MGESKDLIFGAHVGILLPWILITYDISCQWSKNFQSCMSEFPEHTQIKPETKVDVGIPSWHITSHGERCRNDFCLGYTKGAGRTCGEEVEIPWSHTNILAPSVREMAPADQHDTLNDHWIGWNFRKIIGFREYSSFPVLLSTSFDQPIFFSKVPYSQSVFKRWLS